METKCFPEWFKMEIQFKKKQSSRQQIIYEHNFGQFTEANITCEH